jgi:solute carrier family 34 (sodium-dependent phosphate cotransporter)
MRQVHLIIQLLLLLLVLLVFFTSIELMGDAFKLMGRDFARALLEMTSNPFVGLFIGILATSLVQSSSTITSMTVSIVAGGGLTIAGAIPIVMGANIGTSVTNTIVSLGSISRKEEFRRAIAGATVHDFFNLLAVAVLFPLELSFKVVSTSAAFLTDAFADIGGTGLLSPVKVVTGHLSRLVVVLSGESGVIVLLVGLALLFLSLRYLVKLLRVLVLGRFEQILHRYVFGTAPVALLFGVLVTFFVQSSSITTSIIVPLVAAGIVSVPQIYPFVLGANVGTTVTAMLAALVLAGGGELAGIAALKVAFAHLVFNVYGIALFLPIKFLRNIPIKLSILLGNLAVKNRLYALGYVLTVFFVIPLLTIVGTRNLQFSYDPPIPQVLRDYPVGDTSAVVDPDTTRLRLDPMPDALPEDAP